MSLFDKRTNILPYEYPDLLEYMKAIQQSYWIVDEFNYTSDMQNFLSDLSKTPFKQNLIKKAMLAISQIEVNVKTFWGRLDMLFPKIEIGLVGGTFSDSECFLPGHELMTQNGWKKIEEITVEDKVIQLEPIANNDKGLFVNNFSTKLVDISESDIIVKEVDDVVYTFKDSNNDVYGTVTKEHRIVLSRKSDSQVIISTAEMFDNPQTSSNDFKFIKFTGLSDRVKSNETLKSNLVTVSSTKEHYKGPVYCVNVPSSMLLVRYNGNVFVSGNCRHFEAYKRLLELLGLNEEFTRIHEIPALQKRVDYTTKFVENKSLNNEETILSVVLFSMFIEHISLFSQFLILMSFNKYANMFKGISNAVEATSKEEEIHGKFGIALYKILREERPELFTDAFFKRLESMADEAFQAEMEIVDWMYESETGEDLDFLPKRVVKNYIKNRYNRSFKELGLEPKYVVDQDDYKYVEWFDIEVVAIKENDFFNKRSTDYAKRVNAHTADDLF